MRAHPWGTPEAVFGYFRPFWCQNANFERFSTNIKMRTQFFVEKTTRNLPWDHRGSTTQVETVRTQIFVTLAVIFGHFLLKKLGFTQLKQPSTE